MDVERWLAMAQADAERRDLPELKSILQGFAAATRQLRDAPWNEDASARAERISAEKSK